MYLYSYHSILYSRQERIKRRDRELIAVSFEMSYPRTTSSMHRNQSRSIKRKQYIQSLPHAGYAVVDMYEIKALDALGNGSSMTGVELATPANSSKAD
jgi:hypothetical protein